MTRTSDIVKLGRRQGWPGQTGAISSRQKQNYVLSLGAAIVYLECDQVFMPLN